MIDLQGLGDQLQEIRRMRKMTQEQLAENACLSAHYVGNLEQGVRSPSLSSLLQLCHALGVTPDQLLKHSISPEMLAGLTVKLSDSKTLRETANVLSDMLSDYLVPDDEESFPFEFNSAEPPAECDNFSYTVTLSDLLLGKSKLDNP